MQNSQLIIEKKEMENIRLRKLTPEQRLIIQVKLNDRIKKLFYAGLSSRGFARSEIVRLWKTK